MATKKSAILQFLRFAIVGGINTAIDFIVLNVLIYFFGITGNRYLVFKGAGFIVANINSYLMNKFWVFNKKEEVAEKKAEIKKTEFLSFIGVSTTGLFINIGASYLVFRGGQAFFEGASDQLLANIGAFVGTCVVLIWNFVGYKFFVFKK